jgi:hypothetical protein
MLMMSNLLDPELHCLCFVGKRHRQGLKLRATGANQKKMGRPILHNKHNGNSFQLSSYTQ